MLLHILHTITAVPRNLPLLPKRKIKSVLIFIKNKNERELFGSLFFYSQKLNKNIYFRQISADYLYFALYFSVFGGIGERCFSFQ